AQRQETGSGFGEDIDAAAVIGAEISRQGQIAATVDGQMVAAWVVEANEVSQYEVGIGAKGAGTDDSQLPRPQCLAMAHLQDGTVLKIGISMAIGVIERQRAVPNVQPI